MPPKVPHYIGFQERVAKRFGVECRGDKPCVIVVSKDVARAFVEKHHRTQPYVNPRGLLYTLGVVFGDRLVAVATLNTPTGRFGDRRCPRDGVVDLSRVASDGTLVGVASLLASKAIDLLPESGRYGEDGVLLVTYSLVNQAGTTYSALVDKGMRPVERLEGKMPGGQRRKSTMRALPSTPKIRWEAGPAAMPPDWQLLSSVVPAQRLEQLSKRFDEYQRRLDETTRKRSQAVARRQSGRTGNSPA